MLDGKSAVGDGHGGAGSHPCDVTGAESLLTRFGGLVEARGRSRQRAELAGREGVQQRKTHAIEPSRPVDEKRLFPPARPELGLEVREWLELVEKVRIVLLLAFVRLTLF